MSSFGYEETDDLDRVLSKTSGKRVLNPGGSVVCHRELDRFFRRLLHKLDRFYDIDRASLALLDIEVKRLRVTHILESGNLKTGLTLNFSTHNSIMYQVLKQRFPIVDNYPEFITTNKIEKRILLTSGTRSVLIIPLICEGEPIGILSLASRRQSAFGLYLEGVGEGIVADFVTELYYRLGDVARRAEA